MANLINIVTSLEDLYEVVSRAIAPVYFYICKRNINDIEVIEISSLSTLLEEIDSTYSTFYLTSRALVIKKKSDFYSDENVDYVIEGLGGRIDKENVENISLRIISTTPEKDIKRILTKVAIILKDSKTYGVGVGPGSSSFYKKVFYNKTIVKDRTAWFDFERRNVPIEINFNHTY